MTENINLNVSGFDRLVLLRLSIGVQLIPSLPVGYHYIKQQHNLVLDLGGGPGPYWSLLPLVHLRVLFAT